ncbi:hypothetical protein Dvina_23985 [Dactylosporangium vinaceum]|uniref:Uncharacterized protein n=1 Tax=Dactylosporangium vinaceum TaxID=53362 RepID=A0ABV5MD55_9ACTN|nr:hypothetical protein [Dactylosporangium vinaceum]UAC00842.1 hypothetical protein Dvina_23985 [Dactylosporangium vinaceum]
MRVADPTLERLGHSVAVFNGYLNVDRSWREFVARTAPGADLGRAEHRGLLHRLLNSWGCRIRNPRDGEPYLFDDGVAAWWEAFGPGLPGGALRLAEDADLARLGDAYAALAAVPAGPRRAVGATAAAKAMYALRPETAMPWDAAIAAALHGGRDGAAYARHLALGRAWAAAVVSAAGVDDAAVPALLGRPAVSLPKILDEYTYVFITLRHDMTWMPADPAG